MERDHDGLPARGPPSIHRAPGSARWRKPLCPGLSGQRAGFCAPPRISGQLVHLRPPRSASGGAGRRTIAFDFLGFGGSDKPEGAVYTFEQQLGDLEAVTKALELEKIIPVGHDAGGPAAVNFALRHPTRAAGICLMNAFYDESPGLRVPEFIELFANKNLKALTRHFLASPEQFAWLLNFQRGQWRFITDTHKARYKEFLVPIVDKNFAQLPSAGPAFAQMTYQLFDEVAANTARLPDFRRSDLPLLLIWGKADPYLHVSVAEHLKSQAKNAAIHVLEAVDAARIMLANQWS